MKFADSVKQLANLTSTATITPGAAAIGYRTWAQAIADTAGKPEQVAVGDTVCNRVDDVTDPSKWEVADYTIGGTAQVPTLTRGTIHASSNAGAAVVFGGPVTVLGTVDANWLAGLVLKTDGVSVNTLTDATLADTQYVLITDASGNAFRASLAALKSYLGYAGTGAAASSVTLAASSASTVIGTPVTITVSTDHALTGSQSESVTLTAPIAGTWSANPVTLNATTGTVTPTFTPSAAGSGNITASASGTPTLTGGSVAYAATSSSTVPATMAAPVATAGDTTASIAYTIPPNGGSAITGYTVTPYIGATAQTAQTFGAGAGPVTVTGLTDGTAYTFKIHASNTIGPGVDSPASNSVTPAAASQTQAQQYTVTPYGSAYVSSATTSGGTAPHKYFTASRSLYIKDASNTYPASNAVKSCWGISSTTPPVAFSAGAWPSAVLWSANGLTGDNTTVPISVASLAYVDQVNAPGLFSDGGNLVGGGSYPNNFYCWLLFPDGSSKCVSPAVAVSG